MDDRFTLTRRSVLAGGAAAGAGAAALAATGSLPGPLQSLLPGSEPIPVAVLMDDRATMIDFAGPWEVFQDTGVANVPGFSLYTVAATGEPLRTTGSGDGIGPRRERSGLKFIPDYTFADAPQPRLLFMGAQAGRTNVAKRDWIRTVAAKADIVMSVCTGAFVLANTGLIDGLSATTHHDFYDSFEKQFPKVKLVRGTRFVDNGKFISAGGLTSGVDGALHVVQRYYGAAVAQQVADYMEYQSSGWKA